jgi:ABC-2 type transport system ATP-binding protein
MRAENAIVTEGLTKSYGRVRALRGIDLRVRRGEIFGFLGPNGAGKTTTIRCLLDLIRPDGGRAEVLGFNPQVDPVEVRARCGYLPGELELDENLTGEQQLHFLNALRGNQADWGRVRELSRRLELDLSRPIRNLSKGNKIKVGVLQSLMHRPELLILDEPTFGLDPLMQQEVLKMMGEARDEGATVFFSSHILSEVQAAAARVGFIRRGRIVEVAETQSLVGRALRRTRVRFRQPVDVDALVALPSVSLVSRHGDTAVTLQVEGEMDELVKALGAYPVTDLETERPSLEEVFMAYYANHNGEEV